MKRTLLPLLPLLTAALLIGGEQKLQGDFRAWNSGRTAPEGWFSTGKSGKCTLRTDETNRQHMLVSLSAGNEEAILCSTALQNVKAGETVSIAVELKGKGSAGVKLFLYDAERKHLATLSNGTYAKEEFRKFQWCFRISREYASARTPGKKATPAFCRVAFFAGKNSTIEFRTIRAEVSSERKP